MWHISEIWGSHNGVTEDSILMWFYAVSLVKEVHNHSAFKFRAKQSKSSHWSQIKALSSFKHWELFTQQCLILKIKALLSFKYWELFTQQCLILKIKALSSFKHWELFTQQCLILKIKALLSFKYWELFTQQHSLMPQKMRIFTTYLSA